MQLYTVEESFDFIKLDDKSSNKVDFRKVDKQIYRDNKDALDDLGFAVKDLKDRYKGYSFSKDYSFGLELGKLPNAVYSGTRGNASKYIDERINVIDDILDLIKSIKDPKDLNKIVALMERSKEAAGSDLNPAHYQELKAAAREVVAGDAQARKDLKDYEKSFIYDANLLNKVVENLEEKKQHFSAIKAAGYDTSEHGIMGDMANNSGKFIGQTITVATTWTAAKGLYNKANLSNQTGFFAKFKESFKFLGQGLKKIAKSPAIKTVGNYALKGLNFATNFLGPFKVVGQVVLGAAAVAAVAGHTYVLASNSSDTLKSIGKTVGGAASSVFIGDTAGPLQTIASYIIPDLGALFGEKYSWFGSNGLTKGWAINYSGADARTEALTELKEKHTKEGVLA